MATIMVVEDNVKIRANTIFQLEDAGYHTRGYASAEEASAYLTDPETVKPDVLLLDVRLEGKSGVELVAELSPKDQLPPTIIVSGEASINETMEALRLGVYDFIEKPATNERLMQTIRNCLEVTALKKHIKQLEAGLPGGTTILGTTAGVSNLRQQIRRVAPTQGRVLIRGESGTGKELVAASIHENSTRRDGPFIKINCAAIPGHLIESELFGHVRGAFTDARNDKQGLFEQAHGGTLFLDEIGDMDLALQPRLLRVLEDGTVRRVGDTRDRKVDVRVIAATHTDLEEEVREKRFREDLYFRLSALPIEIPPLRDRLDDIPILFTHFVQQACKMHMLPKRVVDPGTFDALKCYHWPGNIRELRNIAERMVVFGGDPLTADQIPGAIRSGGGGVAELLRPIKLAAFPSLRDFKAQCEREYLELVLHSTNWNVSETARILGIQRPHLHQKLNQLGIHRPG
ncbi:MAG: sigma-54 dependent transcriptional regulator [Acidobacteriota bacterium]|nr:sigma-54 dependent transcriptional regulator [Acidobacteriota bacterium]